MPNSSRSTPIHLVATTWTAAPESLYSSRVSWLAGIHDLSYCFQRAGGIANSAYQGDGVGVGLNAGALAGKAMWYARGQSAALKEVTKKFAEANARAGAEQTAAGMRDSLAAVADEQALGGDVLREAQQSLRINRYLPTPTAIVDVCMVIVSAVDLLNGFGPPEKGAGFAAGVDKFKLVTKSLDEAVPDPRDWDSKDARDYTNQNAALKKLVQDEMEDLDRTMVTLMKEQADSVQAAHNACAGALLGLVTAQGIALALYLVPLNGPALSYYWQISAALATLGTVVAYEASAVRSSADVTKKVDDLIGRYNAATRAAELPGTFATIRVPPAPETRVGSFGAVRAGTDGAVIERPSAAAPLPPLAAERRERSGDSWQA